MNMEEIIVNKVSQSSLETIDLEKFYPEGDTIVFDMKDYLFMELILKEKDYRESLKKKDWSVYENKNVSIICSAEAIIPLWAYMLAVSYLQPVAKDVVVGNESFMHEVLYLKNLGKINAKDFEGKRVVIKGCGEKEIPASVYAEITKILLPVVQSIMYGEPCSTVPVFKKRN
ncbi:DUF2480 family protein [Ginsengibacter hankyongi]|uniref:DUF2480 family protein n=2 Tax=Ginsengibacter hankyongi TaxID=2607284 RepID=A0A5J5ILY5_9BACT|nr:DUF2480 family protein [Ginsengibacter hankyongi]